MQTIMDPDPDPGGLKTYGPYESGSTTLLKRHTKCGLTFPACINCAKAESCSVKHDRKEEWGGEVGEILRIKRAHTGVR